MTKIFHLWFELWWSLVLFLLFSPSLLSIGEGHQKDVTACWPVTWTEHSEAPHFLPHPWNVDSTCLLAPRDRSKDIALRHGIRDWTQLRPLYKLLRLVGRCQDLLVLLMPKASVICKFYLFIKSATCQPGVACHFLWSLSALCVWGFWITPRKPWEGYEPILPSLSCCLFFFF